MATVTHVAGPIVGFKGRGIQRCAVCGEKLLDSLHSMAPVGPDGMAREFCFWREGCLVNREGNRSADAGLYTEVEDLPESFCITLVE